MSDVGGSIEGDLVSLGETAEFTGVKKSTLANTKRANLAAAASLFQYANLLINI
ncbi:hypothetical protein ACSHDS_004189 [Vibrio alginolyticus]|uniref:hypothetical protein n=1 Tax=Vibrio alginolyticus TaxID=663 RepID=UPI001BD2F460|nr:hypothetical protein [Vibrio alginolyticus]EJL6751087.1 hypothetical protein [Vibrio alginolyticus]MBS9810406.1 hypothetical protein [Vibrio alginolyticus]